MGRKIIPNEIKRRAVAEFRETGDSAAIAEKLGIDRSALYRWAKGIPWKKTDDPSASTETDAAIEPSVSVQQARDPRPITLDISEGELLDALKVEIHHFEEEEKDAREHLERVRTKLDVLREMYVKNRGRMRSVTNGIINRTGMIVADTRVDLRSTIDTEWDMTNLPVSLQQYDLMRLHGKTHIECMQDIARFNGGKLRVQEAAILIKNAGLSTCERRSTLSGALALALRNELKKQPGFCKDLDNGEWLIKER